MGETRYKTLVFLWAGGARNPGEWYELEGVHANFEVREAALVRTHQAAGVLQKHTLICLVHGRGTVPLHNEWFSWQV